MFNAYSCAWNTKNTHAKKQCCTQREDREAKDVGLDRGK